MLLTGGQQGRDDFQSQVNGLQDEDQSNNKGTAIHIMITDRNLQTIPSPVPDKLVEQK